MGRKFNLFIIKLTSSQLVFWAYKDKEKPPCLWGAGPEDRAFVSKSSGAIGSPIRSIVSTCKPRCTSRPLHILLPVQLG